MRDTQEIRRRILKVLRDTNAHAGATAISRLLATEGVEVQPRTVRFHLLEMDREGLTLRVSRRRGRQITDKGIDELSRGQVINRIGTLSSRIDALAYRMTFSTSTGRGTVITNAALIPRSYLARALEDMKTVTAAHWAMGDRMAVIPEGSQFGEIRPPRGQVALVTVCSVTLTGILMRMGIPVSSRFGGLLEVRDSRPYRFTELIEYGGTTLDPHEIFIGARMTSVRQCARTGQGVICASFREVPALTLDDVHAVCRQLARYGLGDILLTGRPGQPLLGIPVAEGRVGFIVVAGLNPLAALYETGAPVSLRSLAGLLDYARTSPLHEFRNRFPGGMEE